jgi:hypothetical protein
MGKPLLNVHLEDQEINGTNNKNTCYADRLWRLDVDVTDPRSCPRVSDLWYGGEYELLQQQIII